jgi:hypothetical protein
MRADLKNFNFFQLRSLECELKYLLTEIVHPRARANITQRLAEVNNVCKWKRGNCWAVSIRRGLNKSMSEVLIWRGCSSQLRHIANRL